MCDARVRPFRPFNELEVECRFTHPHPGLHEGVLRDYAYTGSMTVISWMASDRRSFRGEFHPCVHDGCLLPLLHHGECAS
jgi:hypothetical protein